MITETNTIPVVLNFTNDETYKLFQKAQATGNTIPGCAKALILAGLNGPQPAQSATQEEVAK